MKKLGHKICFENLSTRRWSLLATWTSRLVSDYIDMVERGDRVGAHRGPDNPIIHINKSLQLGLRIHHTDSRKVVATLYDAKES